MRIGKVARILLGTALGSSGTGLILGVVLRKWPDLWFGWLALAGFVAFGVLINLADVAINLVDSWLRRSGER